MLCQQGVAVGGHPRGAGVFSTRFADSNVLDTTKDGDTRETNVQAVVSILVPNEARSP
jgi:hypothetical protein